MMTNKIVITLIVLVVAGFGYFYLNQNQLSKPTQVGWLTYANKDFGISFNYPPDYKIYQTDEKTLRVTANYKDPQFPLADIAMVVKRVATIRETKERIEARFKHNITPETPTDIRNKLSTQTSSSQNKGNYNLFRVEDGMNGKYFFLQSDKGTYYISFGLNAGKIDYQNYENQFNQIIDSIKIN